MDNGNNVLLPMELRICSARALYSIMMIRLAWSWAIRSPNETSERSIPGGAAIHLSPAGPMNRSVSTVPVERLVETSCMLYLLDGVWGEGTGGADR
jgi:hypothetical protein